MTKVGAVGSQLWSIVWGPLDAEGERVSYRADRLAQMFGGVAIDKADVGKVAVRRFDRL